MVDIVSYTGSAGLGLGSNPNLPVSAPSNSLDVLNQASRDIAAWANQQNAMLFRQKVADRDNALEMIANDQISTGGILPEYLPEIEKAKEEQIKAFREWKGNPNDTEGYMKYKQAHQKASDLTKVAQINTLGIQDVRKQKAAEPVKYRQSDYDKFEKQELSKGLDDIVNPYQKVMYSDMMGMAGDLNQGAFMTGGGLATSTDTTQKTTVTDTGGKLKTTQTTTTKPATGKSSQPVAINPDGTPSAFTKQPDKMYDFDNVLGRSTVRFLERGPWAEQQELTIEGVQNAPAPQARAFLESINDRIRTYNEQTKGRATPVRELKEGEDFSEITDPNGNKRILLKVNTPEFAAKYALSQYPGNYFEEGATAFNKDAAEFGLKNAESKAKIGALNALNAQRRAAAALTNKKTKVLDEQSNPVKLWDEISKGHVENTITGGGDYVPRVNAKNMSEALKSAIGIDPINAAGDYNVVPAKVTLTRKDGTKQTFSTSEAFDIYNEWLKNDPKAQQLRNSMQGRVPSVFDFLYTLPDMSYEMEIIGKKRPKRDKNGKIIEAGGEITRSNEIQTWLNQQMNTGRKGKDIDMELEQENSSEE